MSPFVGRERELRTLLDLLAQVEAGHGQVVGIVGEPGMGKSRLLYEFRQRLQGAPLTYLEGHCLAYGSPTPLSPVLDLLRHMWGITPADSAEAITERVHTTLRACGMKHAAEAPYLLQLLGIRDGMEGLRGLTPEALKLRTFATLRQASLRSSQWQPLILAVENLHWIDQTSQDFLASLVENLTNASILLLTTYRPGYRPPWMEKSYTTQLTLPPLSRGDSLRVVSAVFPAGQVPTDLAQAILEKADGNPFFLEELAQALVEHGDDVSPLGVPDTVQGVLMARMDRLPDGPRRLLQIAAMLDRTVPLRLLRALWEGPGLLDTALLELQRAEFLHEQTQANESVYGFKHVLMQDVVYQALPASRRQKLHASVGWSMEHLYRGQLEEHAEELTHHFCQGEIWDKAFAYAVHSGDKASAIFSNREAVHFYTLVLEAPGRMTPPPDDARLIALYAHRGQVWSLLTNCDAAVADFEAMLERARCLGDRHREGEALCHLAQAHWHQFSEVHIGIAEAYAQAALTIAGETGDDQVRARSLMSLALVHQVRGHLHAGDQKLEESLAIVRHKQYTEIMPATLVWLGAHANWRGEFQRAIALSLEGAQMAQQVHDGFQELFALSFLCLAYASLGEWDLAFATLHDGMAKARQWDNAFIMARLTNTLGWFYSELGDVARACAYDQEGYELGRAARVSNTEISALINLGFDYLYLEQSETARRLLEEAFDRVEREVFGSHRWRWKIRLCLGLGRLWHREHEPAKAFTFLNDGLRLVLATGSQKYAAEGHGLRGEILVAAGQRDQGLCELQQGLALARSLSCPTLTWRLAQLLGRTYERWGDMRQAQEMYTTTVTDALAVAERLYDTRLQATLLMSPQVTSIRDDLARLG